jgi:HemY protein
VLKKSTILAMLIRVRNFIFTWGLLLSLALLLLWLTKNHGYVLIMHEPYRVQFSFNFLLLLLFFGAVLVFYLARGLMFLRRLPANKRNKKAAAQLQASNEVLLKGMQALADGDYDTAEIATKRAAVLIENVHQEMALEKLLEKLTAEKNKQADMFKETPQNN